MKVALVAFQSQKKELHNLKGAIENDETVLQSFGAERGESTVEEDGDKNVLLFPVIQAGQFGIFEEETTLGLLFQNLQHFSLSTITASSLRPLIDVTSGYFGLYKPYQDLILKSAADVNIFVASPKVGIVLPI